MPSVFTKIINREIPAHVVAEDDQFIAFLDINPLVKGHTLVVPKVETDYFFDLEDDTLAALNIFCKKVARAIEKEVSCLRVGVCVLGLEVPHAHVHLIPLNTMGDINFGRPKLKLSNEEFTSIAEKISNQFSSSS